MSENHKNDARKYPLRRLFTSGFFLVLGICLTYALAQIFMQPVAPRPRNRYYREAMGLLLFLTPYCYYKAYQVFCIKKYSDRAYRSLWKKSDPHILYLGKLLVFGVITAAVLLWSLYYYLRSYSQ